jgi:MFS transporter, DHA1 family, multidrug resistance protein
MARIPAQRGTPALLPVIVFFAFLDNFAQFPILAPLAVSLGADALLAGIIVGAYSLTNLLGNLVVGRILDRRGTAGPLLVSVVLTACILAAYAVVASAGGLLALRLAHGATAAAIVPAVFVMAAAHSTAEGETLGRMSALGAAIGLAAVVAPPVAGVAASRAGFAAVYLLLAGLFVAMALLVWWRLLSVRPGGLVAGTQSAPPQIARLTGQPGEELVAEGSAGTLRAALRTARGRALPLVWAGAAALVFAVGSLALLLPLELAAQVGEAASRRAGILLGLFAFAAMVLMGALARVRRALSPQALLGLGGCGLLVMASALGGLVFAGMAAGRPLMVLLGLGFGLAFPTLASSVALRSSPETRGRGYALFYAAFSAGALLGPVSAGLVARSAAQLAFGYLPAMGLAGAAGALCLVFATKERWVRVTAR